MPHLPVARRERGPVLDRDSCVIAVLATRVVG